MKKEKEKAEGIGGRRGGDEETQEVNEQIKKNYDDDEDQTRSGARVSGISVQEKGRKVNGKLTKKKKKYRNVRNLGKGKRYTLAG